MRLTTITTWLGTIPPPVVVICIGVVYAYVAAGRWSWSMLPDAGLAALYLWRPSLGMLAFTLLLGSVRHIPAFAREVAVMLRLDTFEGWTPHIIVFALPALASYTTDVAPSAPDRLPPPATGPTTILPAVTPAARMRPPEWLGAVNDDPTAPHLGVVGPTRLGKTTFVLAALSRRADRLVITTPKGEDVDPWGGAQAHRLNVDLNERKYDWSGIAGAIGDVHYEMLRRNATAKAKSAEQLTLVIDELSTTLANCDKKVKQQILELWNMGAGAGIRMIVIDPEVNATAWGVIGRRDILGNLVFARVEGARQWTIGRLDPNGRLLDPRPLETAALLSLAGDAWLAGREWEGVSVEGGADSGLHTHTNGTHTQTNDAEQRIAKYIEWRRARITRDMARTIRQADGAGLDDTEWAEAGKRLLAANATNGPD